MSSKILITGANGFIGSWLCEYLEKSDDFKDFDVIKAIRSVKNVVDDSSCIIGNINKQTNWEKALEGVDIIVHLAARVHVMKENSDNPLQEFRNTNVDGTINLAKQAIKAGVKRFVYLSSIKVNGENTSNTPFFADDTANPCDAYAISKYEAESALLKLQNEKQLEVAIIRTPLVYGKGVKGNFSRLIQLIKKQWPLPLAGIDNKRSLVNIDNLCSLIVSCMIHKKASGEVFLVSDGHDISTSTLLKEIAQAINCKSYLFKIPPLLFKIITTLVGKKAEYLRLSDSLQVDISKNKDILDWIPKLNLASALKNYFA